jgi:5'-3' exonuclease
MPTLTGTAWHAVALTVSGMANTLLAVDGNSLVHRSFHALLASDLKTRDGRPTWAVKGFCSQLLGALARSGASAVIVGFDDHTSSVRRAAHPHYKATRKPKPPELGEQLATTIELLRSAGVHVVVPAGLEADDVLASAAATATAAGWNTVIVTSDRDSFALIDEHTSVLRVLNGGIDASPVLTPTRLATMIGGVRPDQYREYAAMRGDTSDNLAGIPGVGEKTAAKLLSAFGTVAAAFDDVDAGGVAVTAALGRAAVGKLANPDNRAAFARNVEIMTMRTDLDLGLNLTVDGGAGRLPLSADRVLAAFDALELFSVRDQAVRTLTGDVHGSDSSDPGIDDGRWPSDLEPALSASSAGPGTDPVAASTGRARREERATAAAVVGAMGGSTAQRPAIWDDDLF